MNNTTINFDWLAVPVFLLMSILLLPTTANGQGVTTATIRGEVVDTDGDPLPGANVVALHNPSGSQSGAATNQDGRFNIAGLRVGGPYTITVSFIGFQSQQETEVYLDLGERRSFTFTLREQTEELDGVEIVGDRNAIFGKNRTGVSNNISEEDIEKAPTMNREIADYVRLTPQAVVGNSDDDGASISIAGQNNRYNSIFIDGAVSNDVFGLSAQGTDGGQTGASPISIDAIEQFNIDISPYDVTQSFFAGGAINAVTRSGTNEYKGSFAYERRGDTFAEDLPNQPFPAFSNDRYVGRLGGPIIQDKLFFFANFDILRSETPQPFDGGFDEYRGNTINDEGDLNDFVSFLDATVGDRYSPGNYADKASSLDSDKFLFKLDWNINQSNRLSARYSYSQSDNIDAFASNRTNLSFSSRNEVFPNTTKNLAVEWNGNFGNRFANKMILSYKNVYDDRDTNLDQPFPSVQITDGPAEISLGGEMFSTVNELEQDVYTLTNDLNIFLGDHVITAGTHHEYYSIANKFIPFNYGWYFYNSVDDFKQSVCASLDDPTSVGQCAPYGANPDPASSFYLRGFSLVDDDPSTPEFEEAIGDATGAVGEFDAYIGSVYMQDEWQASDRLTVTGGVRLDVPVLLDDPRFANPNEAGVPDDPQIDPRNTTIPNIESFYDMNGAAPGQTMDANLHWSPRFGFNYDVFGDQQTQLRGGVGVFTSRQPFVWPGGMYLNNGRRAGEVANFGPNPFRPNPENGLTVADVSNRSESDLIPSGRLEMFESGYMQPRRLRYSLGVDHQLPFGIVGTLEGQYSNTLQDILVTNVNLRPANETLDGPDNRPIWRPDQYDSVNDFSSGQFIDGRYTNIHRVGNTTKGYSYDITARLRKSFENVGVDNNRIYTDVSYTYGDSYTVNDGTSSQLNSIWDGVEHVNGANNVDVARSDFSIGNRVLARVTYSQDFLERFNTSLSLTYTGQSGRPFSYVIGNSDEMILENGDPNSLVYVPENANDLTFTTTTIDGLEVTPEQQAQAFDEFVQANDYLSSRLGQYAERNGDRTPFENIVDLGFTIGVDQDVLGRNQQVDLTFDIFNFTSLLGDLFNQDHWGRRYFNSSQVSLTNFESFEDNSLTPVYSANIVDVVDTNGDGTADQFNGAIGQDDIFSQIRTGSTYSSQWLMKVGVRYTF